MKKYVLPGMGASSGMYRGEWGELEGGVFLDWPRAFSGTTVRELAEAVVEENGIEAENVVMGSSLGGIVGCEIAEIVKLNAVVLVGSARSKEEISKLLSLFEPLIDYAPIEFVRRVVGKVPAEMGSMLLESEADFIRKMCRAIFSWEGFQGGCELFRIHGRRDRVIPLPEEVDVVIDGGHLIALTHAGECCEAVNGWWRNTHAPSSK